MPIQLTTNIPSTTVMGKLLIEDLLIVLAKKYNGLYYQYNASNGFNIIINNHPHVSKIKTSKYLAELNSFIKVNFFDVIVSGFKYLQFLPSNNLCSLTYILGIKFLEIRQNSTDIYVNELLDTFPQRYEHIKQRHIKLDDLVNDVLAQNDCWFEACGRKLALLLEGDLDQQRTLVNDDKNEVKISRFKLSLFNAKLTENQITENERKEFSDNSKLFLNELHALRQARRDMRKHIPSRKKTRDRYPAPESYVSSGEFEIPMMLVSDVEEGEKQIPLTKSEQEVIEANEESRRISLRTGWVERELERCSKEKLNWDFYQNITLPIKKQSEKERFLMEYYEILHYVKTGGQLDSQWINYFIPFITNNYPKAIIKISDEFQFDGVNITFQNTVESSASLDEVQHDTTIDMEYLRDFVNQQFQLSENLLSFLNRISSVAWQEDHNKANVFHLILTDLRLNAEEKFELYDFINRMLFITALESRYKISGVKFEERSLLSLNATDDEISQSMNDGNLPHKCFKFN